MEYFVEQIGKTINVDTNGCYIGVDFGTTNSIVSYLDIKEISKSNVNVETIAYRESIEQTEYIPTVVTYDNRNDKTITEIGKKAKNNIGKQNIESYDCFKLQLGQNFKKLLREGGKTAEEVTYTYLEELLKKFKKQLEVSTIDKIVATIPETWFRENSNRSARENIREIYERLGYSREQIQLQSEPVAACAYYCWCYFKKIKKAYNGHIMVVDYGGGTLDVTLCQISNGSTIKVLERCGSGEYKDTNGCAGIAFDEAVVKKICDINGLKLDDIQSGKLRNRLEEALILSTDVIEDYLRDIYYVNEDIAKNDIAFSIEYNEEEMDVSYKCLGETFKEINSTALEDAISQIKSFFSIHNVDEYNGSNFQILLIGGFSNFYGVEHAVRKTFASELNYADKRFGKYFIDGRNVSIFERTDRALAVSKGAALIAADVISVDPVCPYNVGISVFVPGSDDIENLKPTDFVVLEKGTLLKYEKIYWFSKPITVNYQNGKLRMFLDDGRANGKGIIRFKLDRSCADIFPNINISGNQYSIGVSMDSDMIIFLHIKDSKDEKVVSLQKLLENISIVVAE